VYYNLAIIFQTDTIIKLFNMYQRIRKMFFLCTLFFSVIFGTQCLIGMEIEESNATKSTESFVTKQELVLLYEQVKTLSESIDDLTRVNADLETEFRPLLTTIPVLTDEIKAQLDFIKKGHVNFLQMSNEFNSLLNQTKQSSDTLHAQMPPLESFAQSITPEMLNLVGNFMKTPQFPSTVKQAIEILSEKDCDKLTDAIHDHKKIETQQKRYFYFSLLLSGILFIHILYTYKALMKLN
jgi:hypothetical protein